METKKKNGGHLNTQYNLRLEPALHKWLKEEAERQERSVNFLINKAVKLFKQQREI